MYEQHDDRKPADGEEVMQPLGGKFNKEDGMLKLYGLIFSAILMVFVLVVPASATTFGGKWKGQWVNSLGQSGPDSLSLLEGTDGTVQGIWSGDTTVSGKDLGNGQAKLSGSRKDGTTYDITLNKNGDNEIDILYQGKSPKGKIYSGTAKLTLIQTVGVQGNTGTTGSGDQVTGHEYVGDLGPNRVRLDFASGNKAVMDYWENANTPMPCAYKIDGDRIILTAPGSSETHVLMRDKDGTLSCTMGGNNVTLKQVNADATGSGDGLSGNDYVGRLGNGMIDFDFGAENKVVIGTWGSSTITNGVYTVDGYKITFTANGSSGSSETQVFTLDTDGTLSYTLQGTKCTLKKSK